MNKNKFYDVIRPHVNLTTQNVMGMDKVLDYLELNKNNIQQTAYIIATAWWETAQTMMPVREAYWKDEAWRKRNLRYYPYYGRGYIQLTWEYNYKKASDYFEQDFVKNPDLVMKPEYALPILVVGMKEGWFTGKKLDNYIDNIDDNDTKEFNEYKNARRIVNGTDKAEAIAKLALIFEKGLKDSGYGLKAIEKPKESTPVVSGTSTPPKSQKPSVSFFDAILSVLKVLFGGK